MADWGELLYLRLPLTDLSFSPFYCLIIDFSAIMFPEVLFVLRLIDDFCWALASSVSHHLGFVVGMTGCESSTVVLCEPQQTSVGLLSDLIVIVKR